jgi:hypothetical protein
VAAPLVLFLNTCRSCNNANTVKQIAKLNSKTPGFRGFKNTSAIRARSSKAIVQSAPARAATLRNNIDRLGKTNAGAVQKAVLRRSTRNAMHHARHVVDDLTYATHNMNMRRVHKTTAGTSYNSRNTRSRYWNESSSTRSNANSSPTAKKRPRQ